MTFLAKPANSINPRFRPTWPRATASKLVRRLPFVARRDAELRRRDEEAQALREQVQSMVGSSAGGVDAVHAWTRPERRVSRRLLRASGLFDEDWYRRQVSEHPALPALADDADPIGHFLRHGAAAGISCHPSFLAAWYLKQVRGSKDLEIPGSVTRAPLLHYLSVGSRQGLSPHPAINAIEYLTRHPEAAEEIGGPLGHLLGPTGTFAVATNPATVGIDSAPAVRSSAEFLRSTSSAAGQIAASRGHMSLQRDRRQFEHDSEWRLKAEILSAPPPLGNPLVSIVLPTRDRAATLGAAIDSVLAQTWVHWELIVVDDGSKDDTHTVLETRADARIAVVRHGEPLGVAAARNSGLDRASGRFIAYLDSDNTWKPDFLDLMVRFMVQGEHVVAYGMSALVEEGGRGRVLYRGMPFSREALRERNYIDCICLVHERSILEDSGKFDESLRRTVDWDLFLRFSALTDFAFLPIIATEYDVWESRGGRITTEESVGYRHTVLQRAMLDWNVIRSGRESRAAGRMSVIVVAQESAASTLDTIRRCESTATGDVEFIVIDSLLSEDEGVQLLLGVENLASVTVRRTSQVLSLEVARNLGSSISSGEILFFLPEGAWCEPGWQAPLVAALENHATIQPVIVRRGGTVWSAGAYLGRRGRVRALYRGHAGDAAEVRSLRQVDGTSAACFAVGARTFLDLEGFDPLVVNSWNGVEFSLRAETATGDANACTGLSVVSLPMRFSRNLRRTQSQRLNDQVQQRVWAGRESLLPARLEADGFRLIGVRADAVDDPDGAPLLIRDRADQPLRWALKIGPRDVPARENWGDWHFAEALRDALERLGHQVSIDCESEWYRSTAYLDDVNLVIRGVKYFDPDPDHLNLAWVISHSDRITPAELANFDAVFGASERWCRGMERRVATPVHTLLQCTDQRRFRPVDADPSAAHDVLVVANARGVRPTVAAALQAGVVPDVYGVRWDGLLPVGSWKGLYVPNSELASYYASAGVVLNDHHEDMREAGFVSNRLFDLTATGARVLSDYMPEIDELFGDVVLTWTESVQIPGLVERHVNETRLRRERREALAQVVRTDHTFDARAAVLSETALGLTASARNRARS